MNRQGVLVAMVPDRPRMEFDVSMSDKLLVDGEAASTDHTFLLVWDKERQFPSDGSCPKCQQMLGFSQAEAGSPELNPVSDMSGKVPTAQASTAASRVHVSRKLE